MYLTIVWQLFNQLSFIHYSYVHSAQITLTVRANELFRILLVAFLTTFCQIQLLTWYLMAKNLLKILRFTKSSASSPTMTSYEHGIMTSPHKMMKNTCVKVVIKRQSIVTEFEEGF